ncbi:TPA: hypothetical protein ACH3X2_14242 [Trebouxia sp. C0005]
MAEHAVSKAGSAKEVWDHFDSTYKANSNTRLFMLLQNLNTIKKHPAEPLAKYFARARAIKSDLEAIEQEIPEAQITLAVLSGLPKDYAVVKTVLLITVKELSLDAILPSLLQTEQELGNEEAVPIYKAKADRRQSQARQSRGPADRQNSASRPGKDDRLCFYCKKPGHLKHECMKRAQDQKNAASTQCTVGFNATIMEQTASGQWVLDSSASKHITFSNQKLQHYRSLDPETATVVTFGNNHQAKAMGIGDFVLRTQAHHNILLRNVLHVPEASANLFSIRTATEAGAQVIFQGNICYIHKDNKLWLEGSKHGYLFVITEDKVIEQAMTASSKQSAELWHRRFGHLGYDNLIKLKGMVDGISVTDVQLKLQQQLLCEPCVVAKQQRDPFPVSSQSSKRALELIHVDVCGPLQVPSRGGAKYIATFLDDYSKLSIVRTIPQKSGVAQAMQEVLQMLETRSGNKLQTARTDRGNEHLNDATSAFFKAKGVTHQTIPPYTPQHKGAAERINRTLMERTWAMLKDAKLSDNMWAEVVTTANYIRNRSPISQNAKTPWEAFSGKRPDVSNMRVFGATAYMHVPQPLRRKLTSHSQKGIFVGYELTSNAYRVLLDNGKMSISKDVTFDEDVKQQHTPITSEAVPVPQSESDELPTTVTNKLQQSKKKLHQHLRW